MDWPVPLLPWWWACHHGRASVVVEEACLLDGSEDAEAVHWPQFYIWFWAHDSLLEHFFQKAGLTLKKMVMRRWWLFDLNTLKQQPLTHASLRLKKSLSNFNCHSNCLVKCDIIIFLKKQTCCFQRSRLQRKAEIHLTSLIATFSVPISSSESLSNIREDKLHQ